VIYQRSSSSSAVDCDVGLMSSGRPHHASVGDPATDRTAGGREIRRVAACV